MDEMTERKASRSLPALASPSRRLVMKGAAGLGAVLTSSSLLSAALAQAQASSPPGNESEWGPFTPSGGAGQYLELVYPPSTKAGELQIGVTYTLWIPDGLKTVRAVIVHQHGASIPAAQAGATSAYDLHCQALSNEWDFVVLGPSY